MNEITSFDEVSKSKAAVVLDCWAPWCMPCKMLLPVFEQVAKELDGKAKFLKCNIDEQQEIANQLVIRSIPTLIVFRNGEEKNRFSGSMSANQLKEWITGSL